MLWFYLRLRSQICPFLVVSIAITITSHRALSYCHGNWLLYFQFPPGIKCPQDHPRLGDFLRDSQDRMCMKAFVRGNVTPFPWSLFSTCLFLQSIFRTHGYDLLQPDLICSQLKPWRETGHRAALLRPSRCHLPTRPPLPHRLCLPAASSSHDKLSFSLWIYSLHVAATICLA